MPQDKMRVLHIVPETLTDPSQRFLGSTKDIRGRTEYFQIRGISSDERVARNRDDRLLLAELKSLDLGSYTAACVELPLYPRSIQYIHEAAPAMMLITRAINAEFYHRLHFIAAMLRKPEVRATHSVRQILKEGLARLKLDWTCAKSSDYLLSISQWEEKNYWRYLAGISKAKTVPYFLPSSYQAQIRRADKQPFCVCLMSSGSSESPFLLDSADNFSRLVIELGTHKPHWQFFITGSLPVGLRASSSRITFTGLLNSPFEILAEARSVVILSNYGFGFKTKLLDALCAGCRVLVPPQLFERLPQEIQPYCRVVHLNSVDSFAAALDECEKSFPPEEANAVLRKRAFDMLDSILFDG